MIVLLLPSDGIPWSSAPGSSRGGPDPRPPRSASARWSGQAATTLNLGVGVGSGTVSGNAYLPGDVTILVGDSLKWTIESDEPHSVTFGNGPAGTPPDEWPVTGLTGTVPPPPGTGEPDRDLRRYGLPQHGSSVQGLKCDRSIHHGRNPRRTSA